MKKLELSPQNFRYDVLHLLYSGGGLWGNGGTFPEREKMLYNLQRFTRQQLTIKSQAEEHVIIQKNFEFLITNTPHFYFRNFFVCDDRKLIFCEVSS